MSEIIRPVRIMVAVNGARRTKADHPALPMTAAEIGTAGAACVAAGAAAIHLHVRDAEGRHSLDPGRYREAIAEIRRQAGGDVIVQATTEAVGRYSPAEQMAMVREVRPEAFSVSIRELFADPALENAAAHFLADCAAAGTAVQYIQYDPADLARFEAMAAAGIIPAGNAEQILVLGRYGDGPPSTPPALLAFLGVRTLPLPWSVCAFGPAEAGCCAAAALLGGDVRMGFENNLQYPDGSPAPDNAALVAHFRSVVAPLGLRPLTAREARARLFPTRP